MSIGVLILIQTILVCLTLGSLYKNFWFSYILILIIIGGLLILFIYITRIASNEKFKFNIKIILILTLLIILTLIINNYSFEINELTYINNLNIWNSIRKYYNFPNYKITIFIIIYLLITLIVVVKISKTNKGPLRQIF